MSVELSKQKLDIDSAARGLQVHIQRLQEKQRILEAGIKAIDQGENMLEGPGILAGEVRKIMKEMSRNQLIPS